MAPSDWEKGQAAMFRRYAELPLHTPLSEGEVPHRGQTPPGFVFPILPVFERSAKSELIFVDTATGLRAIVSDEFIQRHGVDYGPELRKQMTAAIIKRIASSVVITTSHNDADNVMVVDAVVKL